MPAAELVEGTVISRGYALIAPIGEGGMARVWSARRLSDGGSVALKFVAAGAEQDPSFRRRFEREAKLLSRLGELSPQIVRVEDFELESDNGPFLVMELLSGETLAARLASGVRPKLPEVVRIVQQLAAALAVAHDEGVVHRDVKPANIFLHRPGAEPEQVKLLDFGVAKLRKHSDLTLPTREGVLLGTPEYMSPEQFLGETSIDARADLWSVGVVAYRMLVGHAPFSRGPAAELAARVLGQEPAAPSSLVPGLPASVNAFFQRALAKRARDRFASAAELSESFAQALLGQSERPRARAERHAKGVNLIELVKLLRIERRAGRLGELSAEDEVLLEERILVSSWYPIERFWRLLELARERVLGGSEQRTIELGRQGARRVVGGVHNAFVQHEDLARGIKSFQRGWATYFDFGEVECRLEGDVVRIVIRGYFDMPRTHALSTLGWYEVALTMLGFHVKHAEIVSGPWSGGGEVTLEYRR